MAPSGAWEDQEEEDEDEADPEDGILAELEEEEPQQWIPPPRTYTTLGLLYHMDDPYYEFFHYHFLVFMQKVLVDWWWCLQGKEDHQALRMWLKVGRLLELDRKSLMDLFMLAQVIPVGRTKANKILWDLLTGPALEEPQRDMSNLVTTWVYKARKTMDRPPREHGDLDRWDWPCYWEIDRKELKWACHQVPKIGTYEIYSGPGRKPVPPPDCFVERRGGGGGGGTWM